MKISKKAKKELLQQEISNFKSKYANKILSKAYEKYKDIPIAEDVIDLIKEDIDKQLVKYYEDNVTSVLLTSKVRMNDDYQTMIVDFYKVKEI